jgi:GT2 family glycosyltransferase
VHIPHLLLHRATPTGPADPAADADHRRAVQDHLERCALPATVEAAAPSGWRLRWQTPDHEPSVTLVVPTRNGLKLLRRCIDSVFELTRYANFDLIVIDNGSDDRATLRYLDQLRRRQRVRVHRDDRPFNYAALNNAAVRMTNSSFVALVNNDIEVISPDWLTEMVGLAALPGVGAVGARLWYGNRTLQHAGVVLGIFGVAGHVHRRLPRDRTGYAGRAALLQNFSAVTAACMVVRRSHYLAVGGLDEKNLAVDYNDVDFCLRLREAGLRNVWTPQAELFHHESATRGAKRTPQQRERYAAETAWMRQRWGRLLTRDPAYNPNLTLAGLQFSLSASPRVSLTRPWFDDPAPADPPE